MGATPTIPHYTMYWILDKHNSDVKCFDTLREAKEYFEDFYSGRTDYRIEKARNFYEVALMKQVEGSVENDFESMEFEDATNYREAARIAKEASMKWDACDVICYTWTETSMYEEIYREQYIKGKKQFRWTL